MVLQRSLFEEQALFDYNGLGRGPGFRLPLQSRTVDPRSISFDPPQRTGTA